MSRRVLVTRPPPCAERTALHVSDLGFEAIMLPLSETVPLAPPGIDPDDFDIIAVTSASALRHASPALLEPLLDLTVFAVGANTAAACRRAGFDAVVEGPGDATGLARVVTTTTQPESRVLYLCGRERRPQFESLVAAARFPVTALEVYDTLSVTPSDETVRAALRDEPATDALLYSRKAAQAIARLAVRPKLADLFARTQFICISWRVGMILAAIAQSRCRVAERPNENAMLALLEQER